MLKIEETAIKQYFSKLFNGLKFNEEKHEYTFKGEKLISTTTFLKRYYNDFETQSISSYKAYKYNKEKTLSKSRDDSYYKKRWDYINKSATNKGSRIHEFVEYNYPDFIDEPYCYQEEGIIEFFNNLDKKYIILAIEYRLYNIKYKKAGTIDLVLYNTETKNILLADWKTNNKSIFKFYKDEQLLDPFNSYPCTDFCKYSIQLSDYQNMLDLNNCKYKIEDKWIIHLHNNDWTVLDNYINADKYNIDYKNPLTYGKNYRVYSCHDFTSQLLKEYEKII